MTNAEYETRRLQIFECFQLLIDHFESNPGRFREVVDLQNATLALLEELRPVKGS